jgi:type I restriction enzyme S subunit
LRFPGFQEEWEQKRLGDAATNRSEKYNPANGLRYIKCIELEHLAGESGHLLGYIDGSKSGSIKNVFNKGDVLFGKLRPYLRKYLQAPFDGVCSSEIWVLKGKDVSNDFLYQVIQTNKFVDLANQSSGSKMPRADWSVVEKGIFSFPSISEQQKIAHFLTLIDDRIQAQSKIIENLETLIKGLSEKLFSQQLRFKEESGHVFPSWEIKKLGDIGEFYSGGTPLTSKREYFNGNIPFIRSGEINSSKTEQFISELGLKNSSAKIVKVGDILFALYGATSGEVAISKITGAINQAVLCIKSKQNHYFIYSYLSHKKDHIVKVYLQGGQGNLSTEIVKGIEIPIPILPEQTLIANLLLTMNNKKDIEKELISKYQRQKKFLLNKLFI